MDNDFVDTAEILPGKGADQIASFGGRIGQPFGLYFERLGVMS